MKKRPSSACPSRTTPSTARPLSAQVPRTRAREGTPSRAVRFKDRPETSFSPVRTNVFVTSNASVKSSFPNLGGEKKVADGVDENYVPPENRSVALLRGLVTAEAGLKRTSVTEILIQAFLRAKSDIKVLRDFSGYCLLKPQDVDTSILKVSAQDLFATNVNDNTRFIHLIKLHELRDRLIFDICSGFLVERNLRMKEELEPIPDTCSPRLDSFLQFIGTFMDISSDMSSKNSHINAMEEKNIQSMQEKCKQLEQSYANLKKETKILKTKYTNIMTEGGKNQGMARQQYTIDELELKLKNMSKRIEDAENAKKMALKSEMKLKDDVLQLQAQLDTVKGTYEGELGSLKPMVYEQVSYTSENLKEIRDLQTNILLAKERYSTLLKQFEETKKELYDTKQINSELNRNLGVMTDKADAFQSETVRLEKVLKVTVAAKMSSDHTKKVTEDINEKVTADLNQTRATLESVEKERETLAEKLRVSEGTLLATKRQESELKAKHEAKCCEIVTLEVALDEQAAKLHSLMKRFSLAGGDTKMDKNVIGGKIHAGLVPHLSLANANDYNSDSSGGRSNFLDMLDDEIEQRHAAEIQKKDNKIKKLEDKLRKSQEHLKDVRDRVWQLEKAKLDEAAGVIPMRKN